MKGVGRIRCGGGPDNSLKNDLRQEDLSQAGKRKNQTERMVSISTSECGDGDESQTQCTCSHAWLEEVGGAMQVRTSVT